jgi:peptide/nickel transport system substrate-binding protein
LSFRFNVHANDPHRVQTGEFMREWAAEAGIDLRVEPVDEVGSLLDAGTYDLLTTGWGTGPDPDGILAINLCDARPSEPGATMSSDAFFCDETYDELYEQQRAEVNVEDRGALIQQMDQILYESGVFVILGYPAALEAYRTDQIDSIQPQPDPGGNLYNQDGYWAWWSATPAGPSGDEAGNTTLVVVMVVGLMLVTVSVALVLVRRRAATADDRE